MTTIRDATEADADFIAWAIHTAGRSTCHAAHGSSWAARPRSRRWRSSAGCRVGPCPHEPLSLFLIAEVDGRPAAALCGYDGDTQGPHAMLSTRR